MQTIGVICAASLAVGASAAGAGEAVAVPSGQELRFYERVDPAVWPAGERSVHFRFLAPAIARAGGAITIAEAGADMQVLCDDFALSMLAGEELPDRIVINLADREVPFGEADPQATQFFESYRVEDGACIWEAF